MPLKSMDSDFEEAVRGSGTHMYEVGFATGTIGDPDRPDWDGKAARPLAWSAWYPAGNSAGYPADVAEPAPALFRFDRTARNAGLAADRQAYPVVLLSHGTGGTAGSLAWLAHGLARQGFFVIGIDHHGNTGSEPYRPEGFLCWWERARDLTVVLDDHARGAFAGRLDLDRVFACGFSLGGHAVLSLLGAITSMPLFLQNSRDMPWGSGPREFPGLGEQIETLLETSAVFRRSWEKQSASYRDRRIRAALLCAPAPTVRGLTEESLRQITLPVAIAAVGQDREAPADLCAEWLHNRLANSTFDLLHPDAGHYAFLCECTGWGKEREPDICRDPPGVERSSVHRKAIELAVARFSL